MSLPELYDCPKCANQIFPCVVTTELDVLYTCLRCKRVFIERLEVGQDFPRMVSFTGDVTVEDTIDFYLNTIRVLQAALNYLESVMEHDLSQAACHYCASLSLVIRDFAAVARERLDRLSKQQPED